MSNLLWLTFYAGEALVCTKYVFPTDWYFKWISCSSSQKIRQVRSWWSYWNYLEWQLIKNGLTSHSCLYTQIRLLLHAYHG